MARFTVGSVPYVNAMPLIGEFLLKGEESPVRVTADIPSRLPHLLDEKGADAVLVSSIEALRRPGARIADGLGIISRGKVDSVRVLSRTPFEKIEKLALDVSSMTSNALARIVLKESYGVSPATFRAKPDLEAMLAEADACVLIGDIGMLADGSGLFDLDLGEAWWNLTGLPFVWAAWVGEENLTPELASFLQEALSMSGLGQDRRTPINEEVLDLASRQSGWSPEMTRQYLCETMNFHLDESAWKGLETYSRLLSEHQLIDGSQLPAIVKSERVAVAPLNGR